MQGISDLIDCCLALSPEERPSAADIFKSLRADRKPVASLEGTESGSAGGGKILSSPNDSVATSSTRSSRSEPAGRSADSGSAGTGSQPSGKVPLLGRVPAQDASVMGEGKPLQAEVPLSPEPQALLEAPRRARSTRPANPFEQR